MSSEEASLDSRASGLVSARASDIPGPSPPPGIPSSDDRSTRSDGAASGGAGASAQGVDNTRMLLRSFTSTLREEDVETLIHFMARSPMEEVESTYAAAYRVLRDLYERSIPDGRKEEEGAQASSHDHVTPLKKARSWLSSKFARHHHGAPGGGGSAGAAAPSGAAKRGTHDRNAKSVPHPPPSAPPPSKLPVPTFTDSDLAGKLRDVRLARHVIPLHPSMAAAGGGADESKQGTPAVTSTDADGHARSQPASEGLTPCPLRKEVVTHVVATNAGSVPCKVWFRPLRPVPADAAVVLAEPMAAIIPPRGSATVKVTVTLVSAGQAVSALLACQVVGGVTTYCLLQAMTETAVFGIDVGQLPFTTLWGLGVPHVVAEMCRHLVRPSTFALNKEGIFRVGGDGSKQATVKAMLNAGKPLPDDTQGYIVSNLVKVFFRELPVPLLSHIPVETMLAVDSLQTAQAAAAMLRHPERGLLQFVVTLLGLVACHEGTNLMNAKACAIVMAPNLLSVSTVTNPMEALMVSQKASRLLTFLVEARTLELRSASCGADLATEAATCVLPHEIGAVAARDASDGGS